MTDLEKRLWTLEDVAEFLQVKVSVIKYWMYSAGLPYFKLGKHTRFSPYDLKDWVKKHKCDNNDDRNNNDLRLIT